MNKLISLCKWLDYKILYSNYYYNRNAMYPEYSGVITNHSKKTITIRQRANYVADRYLLSHEIGHIIENRILKARNNMSKYEIITREITAWIIALFICIRYSILTREFFKVSYKCLKSYIKRKEIYK